MARRDVAQFKLRAAPALLDWLKEQAGQNRRSINSEIEFRLEVVRKAEQLRSTQSEKPTVGEAS